MSQLALSWAFTLVGFLQMLDWVSQHSYLRAG